MVKEFSFAKRRAAPEGPPLGALPSWKLLIVDDEPEIHAATELALRKLRYADRGLEIISAYSSADGLVKLAEMRDIAVILLDVVMEDDDSGLTMTRLIREQLGNTAVRIILRTGQPGQAPEERIIFDYDINDYKTKTELTTQKLMTSVVAALRSYEHIQVLETGRRGLTRIIEATDSLMKVRSLRQFASGVLEQLAGFLDLPVDGILCLRRPHWGTGEASVLAGCGKHDFAAVDHTDSAVPIDRLDLPDDVQAAIQRSFAERSSIFDGSASTLYLEGSGELDGVALVAYIRAPRPVAGQDRLMIEMFCAKIAIAYENIELYNELERRVEERTEELNAANAALERLATIDPLTEALNRRAFLDHAARELQRLNRHGGNLSLLMCDLDRFKSINDDFGHASGDAALNAFAQIVQQVLRQNDTLGRIGGEEFGILLPVTNLDGALLVAGRVRQAVEEQTIGWHGIGRAFTVSIGATEFAGGETLSEAMGRADKALYRAKEQGRNRVEAAGKA